MPCITNPNNSPAEKSAQVEALKRLQAAIGSGAVRVVIGRAGGIAFAGWSDRAGVSDLCAYRMLANTSELRRAQVRAEAMSGHKVDPRAIASGLHSHDNGQSWATD